MLYNNYQMKNHSFIDVFAGAGGLAEGFTRNGFRPVAHIEMNKDACNTLVTRSSYYYLKSKNRLDIYRKYLKREISRQEFLSHIPNDIIKTIINETITEKNIKSVFDRIRNNLGNKGDTIDVLVGGPPCQAYSLVGRAVSGPKISNDPRNFLYKLYIRFLNEFKPKVFVFENVLGLLSANSGLYLSSLKDSIRKAGYIMSTEVLTASDYGVLQNRKRIIIIGIRNDLKQESLYPEKVSFANKYYVKDVLSDLPSLAEIDGALDYSGEPTKYCLKTGIRDKNDVLTWHTRRYINAHDQLIYRLAIDNWNVKKRRIKYTDIPEELRTHKNQKAFLDRFKVVASNVHESQTILAHLSKDGHYFIHPDLEQCRSISVREAARLQSFPDSYYFEGSRGAAFTQIGNAVPPLMSSEIAKTIKKYLEEIEND